MSHVACLRQPEATGVAVTLHKGGCPLGRGQGAPTGAADGVLLTGPSGGISWGLSQLYPRTNKMVPGVVEMLCQWLSRLRLSSRCWPWRELGTSGREEAGLHRGG